MKSIFSFINENTIHHISSSITGGGTYSYFSFDCLLDVIGWREIPSWEFLRALFGDDGLFIGLSKLSSLTVLSSS